MEIQQCIRCSKNLRAPQGINSTGDKAVVIFVSTLTVGFRPRLKARAERQVFCVPCAVSIAFGPPPENAMNLAVWATLRDLERQGLNLAAEAHQQMIDPHQRLKLMPGSQPDRTMSPPITRPAALSEAV